LARRTTPPPPQRAVLTPDAIRRGIAQLNRRIADLEAFDPQSVGQRDAPEVKALEATIDHALATAFGLGTFDHNQYRAAATLDHGPRRIRVESSWIAARTGGYRGPVGDDLREVHQYLTDGKRGSLVLLQAAVKRLQEELEDLGEPIAVAQAPSAVSPAASGREPTRTTETQNEAVPAAAIAEIREVVDRINAELPALALANSAQAEITADIAQIKVETDRPSPRRRFLVMYLESLRDNLAKAAGAGTATVLVGLVGGLLAKYFGLL
jgi:hypothetical protein